MISSKKAAYVANGAELDQPFEDNELLNRKDDFPFEDPPWRVLDTEAVFEPMEIRVTPIDSPDSENSLEADLQSEQPTSDVVESDPEAKVDESQDQSSEDADVEGAIEPEPTVIGLTEAEAEARVAEAVAAKQVELTEQYEPRIKELEQQLADAQAEVERVRIEVRESAETEFNAQLEASRETYDGLTQKLVHASDNVSEFFEPLSRLAVHVGAQLVRGELTVGPTAIARLVQGCLDQLEGYQPKNPPILKMHPEDLAMYLSSIDGEPDGVQLRSDESMARGDASLQMDDTAVDDLIAHRLERLANHIFGIGHGFTDELFRTPLSTESDTELAFNEIDDFIEHEVVDTVEVSSEEVAIPIEKDNIPAEAEAEAESNSDEKPE